MNCPVCNSGNPHEARFCVACGVPLGPQGERGAEGEGRGRGLAPLDLSGLLEETVSIYRSRLAPFILLALIAQIPALLTLFFDTEPPAITAEQLDADPGQAFALLGGALAVTFAMVFALIYIYYMVSAASVMAVSQYYVTGRIDVGYCFKRAWYRIASLTGGCLVFGLSMTGALVLMLILVGIPLFFYLLVVWYFFVECIMLERKGPTDSLWRSRDLVKDNFWRVFLIGVVYVLIGTIPAMAAAALTPISPLLATLFGAAVGALITPIGWIGRTLVYYDLRVRKEGYSMDDLARDAALPGSGDETNRFVPPGSAKDA